MYRKHRYTEIICLIVDFCLLKKLKFSEGKKRGAESLETVTLDYHEGFIFVVLFMKSSGIFTFYHRLSQEAPDDRDCKTVHTVCLHCVGLKSFVLRVYQWNLDYSAVFTMLVK